MKVLILDNFDSFTYNLYQYAGEILESSEKFFQLDVIRNNEITIEEIQKQNYDRIIISPGPGDPADKNYFGVCADVLLHVGKTTRVLGVCLGMQGIAHYFGGRVIRAKIPMHGKTSRIQHDSRGVFSGLPQDLEVMRYHSLIVDSSLIPPCLEVTAFVNSTVDKEIMGLRHKSFPIEGIQFHPESFATEGGMKMIENFLLTEQ
ncbi:MAG: aminodeoxychorismate/anthranilate synthase component II [Leptospiraceae bacterium]|nr:aminodeoxychorismate/anthranilate synthase component II [Leptospiraceae bacterium]MCK6381969.1 aminodeoxychorismate/anthranilate synthase component II [Leptospiraceae bacterium]NUM40307.1 aminodeoxychorismate/anthranilate synthase component II [Leptospiraceae bacterium]